MLSLTKTRGVRPRPASRRAPALGDERQHQWLALGVRGWRSVWGGVPVEGEPGEGSLWMGDTDSTGLPKMQVWNRSNRPLGSLKGEREPN